MKRSLLALALLVVAATVRAKEAATAAMPPTTEATAAAPAPTGTVSANADTGEYKLLENITASVAFEGFGPSIATMGNTRPNLGKSVAEDPKSPVYSKQKFSIGYKLDATRTAGIGWQFNYAINQGLSGKDPYLFLRDSRLVNVDGFNLDLALRAYLGVSKDAEKYKYPLALRIVQNSSYKFFGTPITANIFGEMHTYIHSSVTPGMRNIDFYLSPNVDVAILPETLTFNLAMKVWSYQLSGRGFMDLDTDPVLLSPGIAYKPTKNLTINPYLDFGIGHMAANMTTIGLNIGWKIL